MRKVSDGYKSELSRVRKSISDARKQHAMLRFIGGLRWASYVYANLWREAVIIRGHDHKPLLKEVREAIRKRTGRPCVARKSFDDSTGTVSLTFLPHGVKFKVIIESTPPRCEIEQYTEEVRHEARYEPAYVEQRTKFRLKNPEECLGGRA